MRILVVEDEYMVAMHLKSELESLDVEVVGPVGRRDHSLALAETEPLDGALLDINLNNGDTIEVAEVLQARGVPVAFVTGYKDRTLPDAMNGLPRLVKPVAPSELQEILARFAASRP